MVAYTERLGGVHVAPGLLRRILKARVEPSRVAAHGMRPPLARRERLLVKERDQAGAPVVATTVALYHRGDADAATGWHRMPWEELGRVRWDRRQRVLELTRFPGGPTRTLRLRLPGVSRIPDVVRERVAATELVGVPVPLGNGTTATVCARRRPMTSELVWVVMVADGVDPNGGDTRARIATAIRELRVQLAP